MKKTLIIIMMTMMFFISCGTEDNGNTGNTGNTGETNDTGDDGNTGDTGNTGNTGDTGDTGNTGDTDDTGDTGDDEESDDVCTPNCDGFTCGDDGCGGSCGVCDKENEGCMNHQCVACSGNFPNAHDGTCWSDLLNDNSDLIIFYVAQEICSSIGGRLPTVDESRSIIINCPETETGGACGITNDCPDCYNDIEDNWICEGCSEGRNTPNTGVYSVFDDEGARWTSTIYEKKEIQYVITVIYRQDDLSSANTNASIAHASLDLEFRNPVRCVSN